jgi:hypothetical protein
VELAFSEVRALLCALGHILRWRTYISPYQEYCALVVQLGAEGRPSLRPTYKEGSRIKDVIPFPHERIEGKYQLLEELDPTHELRLQSTFTNHLANAIRASTPTESGQELDKAIEAYENALDNVLHKVLGSTSSASIQ